MPPSNENLALIQKAFFDTGFFKDFNLSDTITFKAGKSGAGFEFVEFEKPDEYGSKFMLKLLDSGCKVGFENPESVIEYIEELKIVNQQSKTP